MKLETMQDRDERFAEVIDAQEREPLDVAVDVGAWWALPLDDGRLAVRSQAGEVVLLG